MTNLVGRKISYVICLKIIILYISFLTVISLLRFFFLFLQRESINT